MGMKKDSMITQQPYLMRSSQDQITEKSGESEYINKG